MMGIVMVIITSIGGCDSFSVMESVFTIGGILADVDSPHCFQASLAWCLEAKLWRIVHLQWKRQLER